MFTVSKAFLKSRNTPQAHSWSSIAFLIVSVKSINAWFVESLFLNPNCLEKRHLFSSRNVESLFFTSFSNNLLILGSNETGL